MGVEADHAALVQENDATVGDAAVSAMVAAVGQAA